MRVKIESFVFCFIDRYVFPSQPSTNNLQQYINIDDRYRIHYSKQNRKQTCQARSTENRTKFVIQYLGGRRLGIYLFGKSAVIG